MRDYAKVSPMFWIGETGKQIRDLVRSGEADPGIWAVANYLITNPNGHMLGLYHLPLMYIAHDTGLTIEGARKGLQSLSEGGFCRYDEKTEVVWVVEMARFQVGELLPADNRCKGIQKDYDTLPKCPFLLDFFLKYKDLFHLSKPRGSEAPPKPLRSQEQEQEEEQERSSESPNGDLSKTPVPGVSDAPPSLSTETFSPDHNPTGGKVDSPPIDTSPSGKTTSAAKTSPCPYSEIVDLYHEHLPTLPRVRALGKTNKVHLQNRWLEDPARRNLEWWRRFFANDVATSDFLCGRSERAWKASLDWIVLPTNMTKILNGAYANSGPHETKYHHLTGGNKRSERNMAAAEAFVSSFASMGQ